MLFCSSSRLPILTVFSFSMRGRAEVGDSRRRIPDEPWTFGRFTGVFAFMCLAVLLLVDLKASATCFIALDSGRRAPQRNPLAASHCRLAWGPERA